MQTKIAAALLAWFVCGPLGAGHTAAAQSAASVWPSATVTIVASTPVGSRQDIATRLLAQALGTAFKQTFVIEDRPGGNGIFAARDVAHARPDGLTLLSAGNSPIAANPFLFKSLPYDPAKDFTAIAMITDANPLVLVVTASLPVHRLAEYVAYAKAHPNELTNAGFGQLGSIMGSVLDKAAGIQTLQVRYTNLSPSITDTIQGRTTSMITTLDSIQPYIVSGKLRLIATIGRERFPTIPDVPAIEESYPGIAMEGWFVLLGPAGLDKEIVERINAVANVYLQRPDTQHKMLALGSIVRGDKTPNEVATFVRSETARWGKLLSGLDNVRQ